MREPQPPGARTDAIRVRGARQHNLVDVDVDIPRQTLTVFTGVSGSGKSSLAFDTIYAEGQRRYVESLSAYARQFLGQMDKPDVDSIDGLSPAISIDQKTTSNNPRSTVGTVTEVYDYLRLLYARVGEQRCPSCAKTVTAQSISQIVDQVQSLPTGTRIELAAPLVRARKGAFDAQLTQLARDGFTRVRVDGAAVTIDDIIDGTFTLDPRRRHNIDVVVDRATVGPDSARRVTDSIETVLSLTPGLVHVRHSSNFASDTVSHDQLYTTALACLPCGRSFQPCEPRSFSFNSPFGACADCSGLGTQLSGVVERIIADDSVSVQDGAIVPWSTGMQAGWYTQLAAAVCRLLGADPAVPWCQMDPAVHEQLLYGLTDPSPVTLRFSGRSGLSRTLNASFDGVVPYLVRQFHTASSDRARRQVEPYLHDTACRRCAGQRLSEDSLAVTIAGLNIAQLCALPVRRSREHLAGLELAEHLRPIAQPILSEIDARLRFLDDVGLDYLSLDRPAATLSGGEAQRIRLATQIGSALVGVLYVLDEPSIGLHQRDNRRLLDALEQLRDLGNTLIVVEHDRETIQAADHVVDVGPGAGENGGHIVHSGTLETLLALPAGVSVTADYLSGRRRVPIPAQRRRSDRALVVRGARANNLTGVDVSFPLGVLTCVTGVSGSGKSSLVNDVLARQLARQLNGARTPAGRHDTIDGVDGLERVVIVDQSPIGRTPRSNPATYTGVFDHIRALFAATPEARTRGYKPGRFSFNVAGGRCETCQGDGTLRVEMHFLPDVYVPCAQCNGDRYNRETLEVLYRGRSIAQVLGLTVDQALAAFTNVPAIRSHLETLSAVGLGYIRLGQAATTLSGGEAQRVKLASELRRRARGTSVYILDEPTTGLHFDDVRRLVQVLHALVDRGSTVIVIEHDLDVVKTADHVIDLGPEGGDGGGQLVVAGTPEQVAACPSSHTGRYLAPLLEAAQQR